MLKGAVARRYAGAMFDLARKQNTLDRTLDDVQGIAKLFSKRKVSFLLREPKVPAQRKEKAVREALQTNVLPMSLNFALLLIQRDLVEYTPNIATELEKMVRDYRNEAVAEVTTATPMDAAQGRTIQQALEQRTGKTIIVHPHTDPAILGGVIARVGDQLIDGSVRYRLSLLEQQMLLGVANSHTDFFSQEELDETAREIGNVDMDTRTAYGAVPQSASTSISTMYGAVPQDSPVDDGTQDNDSYNAVPNAKPAS
jgi:F-type H+-transporting ATPase subunit delta